jgi:hypothetical protein
MAKNVVSVVYVCCWCCCCWLVKIIIHSLDMSFDINVKIMKINYVLLSEEYKNKKKIVEIIVTHHEFFFYYYFQNIVFTQRT